MALQANALALVATLRADQPAINSDALAERYINAASDFVENVCNRRFQRSAAKVEKLKAFGTVHLSVSLTPLESITSIVLDGNTVDSSSYEIDGDGEAGLIFNRNGWTSTAQAMDAAGPFSLPGTERRAYTVTYKGGYHLPNDGALPAGATALPAIITEACLMVAATMFSWRGRDLSIQAESVGNASVQFGGGVEGRKLLTQSVREMLADYVRPV